MSLQPTAGDALLERFHLLEELGSEGTTHLWLAEDQNMGERVALRVLAPELVSSEAARERMRQVCRQARRLAHPGMLRVYDVHADAHVCAISREYVPGSDVGTLRGRPAAEVVEAMLPVVEALEYAHANGMVHGDLKRSKIVGGSAGEWRVADFGLGPALRPGPAGAHLPAPGDDVIALGRLLRWLIPDTSTRPMDRPPAALLDVITRMVDPSCSNPLQHMRGVRIALEPFAARSTGTPAASSTVPLSVVSPASSTAATPRARTSSGAETITPICPVSSVTRSPAVSDGSSGGTDPGLSRRYRRSRIGPIAATVLGLLAATTLAVFFHLPRWVATQREDPTAPPAPAAPTPAVEGPAPDADAPPPELSDESKRLLIELITAHDALRARGAELWGGTEFQRASELRRQAENALQTRENVRASPLLQESLDLVRGLERQQPQIVAAALERAEAALVAQRQRESAREFALALQIDPDNAAAKQGAARVEALDDVLALMRSGAEAEHAGRLSEARDAYAAASKLDPRWKPARDALARVQTALSDQAYTRQMAAAVAAVAVGQLTEAQTAYRAALDARPDSKEARTGLAHIGELRRSQRIQDHRRQAEKAERNEDWQAAVSHYQSVLQLDADVAFAKSGLARSQERLQVTRRMAYLIEHPRELYDPTVASEARDLVATAERLQAGNPRLEAQRVQLQARITEAETPVRVVFESDDRTEVTVQRVGRLGTFARRELMLRPGTYVVRGVRRGYRDVRRTITVTPGNAPPPVLIRCSEEI